MPMQRDRYPKNWKQISLEVRNAADWKCEECSRPCRRPGQNWDEFVNQLPESWIEQTYDEIDFDKLEYIKKSQRFTLTVAHLNHTPEDCDRSNLRALCAPCHLRYDAQHHARNRRRNRFTKLEKEGQLNLFL